MGTPLSKYTKLSLPIRIHRPEKRRREGLDVELDELREAAIKFFSWPSDTKEHVTLTSALIFAQVMMQRERDSLKRPAEGLLRLSCEKFCAQITLNAEIKRLEKAIRETIEENLHLAAGENCTLIKLKRAIHYT